MKRQLDSESRDISPPPTAKKATTSKSEGALPLLSRRGLTPAISSFFTPLSQKKASNIKIEWQVHDRTLLIGKYRSSSYLCSPTKIAAFDLDGTLIKPKSGIRFANDASDWTWGPESFVSRRSRITFEPKAKLLPQWKQKLQAIAETLDIPLMIFAATSTEDVFRKPRIGMWNMYAKELGITREDGKEPDMYVFFTEVMEMFFVGDAGGRVDGHATGRAKDFANTDRKFAMNLKVPYYTPEEYFLGDQPAKFLMGAFNPRDYLPATLLDNKPETDEIKVVPLVLPSPEPDIVLFVGSPASGKSTFFREHLEPMGYMRINQDTLKTRDRCVAEATTLLTDNKHIVIDNTNPTKATRKIWVDLAKKFNRSIRCVYFTASPQLARHNNLVRTLGGHAKENRKLLPMSAIYIFANRFQEPTLDEGFEQITKIDFQFRGTPQEQEIWSMWWN